MQTWQTRERVWLHWDSQMRAFRMGESTLAGGHTLAGISLESAGLLDTTFTVTLVAIPTMSAAVRHNPFSSPQVPVHRPWFEVLKALTAATVQHVTGSVTYTGTGAGTTVGPGFPAPDPVKALFPTLAAAKSAAKVSALTSLGWNGAAGPTIINTAIDGIFDHIAATLQLLFAPSNPTINSGGSVVVTLVVPPTLPVDIQESAISRLEATDYFHVNDDPNNGVALTLQSFLLAIATEVAGTLLPSSSTTVVIPAAGSSSAGTITVSGPVG